MENKKVPLGGSDEATLKLAEEQVEITKHRHVDATVELKRTTHSRQELVETQLARENVEIQHIARNEVITDDLLPQVRQEGDVLIIPVIEEEIEIIRRKVLKEEIHIIKRTTTEEFRQSVTLRNQEVTISKDEN